MNRPCDMLRSRSKKGSLSFLCVSLSLAILIACRHKLEPASPNLELQIIRIAATEVLINVIQNMTSDMGGTIELLRDEEVLAQFNSDTTSFLFLDGNIQPSKVYGYYAIHKLHGSIVGRSSLITITTLPATSHQFQWQTFSFEVAENSDWSNRLWDVWAASGEDVWAVGLMADPLDLFGDNALHFDGQNWKEWQIGPGDELFAVFGLDRENIWAGGAFGNLYKWNGSDWIVQICFAPRSECQNLLGRSNAKLTAIWANSTDNLYVGGGYGNVLHFDGENWNFFPLPTPNEVQDIWGTASGEVFVVTAPSSEDVARLFIRSGNIFEMIDLSRIVYGNQSIWAESPTNIYLAGGDLMRFDGIKWKKLRTGVTSRHSLVRGVAANDIFVAFLSYVSHWNGITWQRYGVLPDRAWGMWTNGASVAIVGFGNAEAFVTLGSRI